MTIGNVVRPAPTDPATATPRARLAAKDAELANRYWQHDQVLQLIAERTAFVDGLILEFWHRNIHTDDLALYAVGGYGRQELLPCSDLDLLIIGPRPRDHASGIESFVHDVYDLHLDVGHSVRALREVKAVASNDLTIATAMFERRALITTAPIESRLTKILAHARLWPAKAFYHAKIDEQNKRHGNYANADSELEPNVKESPGGLRDLHTAMWVFQREFGTRSPDTLLQQGVLTTQERDWFIGGRRYLLWVRYGLHLVAGRKEDRLQFEYQRELAERLGYVDTEARRGVERYMQQYYSHVLTLREVNDIMLQYFDETVLRRGERSRPTPLDDCFQLRGHYIEARSDDLFRTRPSAMLQLFVVMANRRDIVGVRANTIRSIRGALDLIDDRFRADPVNIQAFMDLLKAPYTLVSQLTRMRRYGILSRYLPEFGAVVGQMQHDLFHIYTVDAHTMQVIRNMRMFRYRIAQKNFPVAAHCVSSLAKPHLLYIAGLYHDIGKGRGGDHSTLGASDARAFCWRHGLSAADTDLVDWLVRSHLVMSSTAQRQDIYDPDVIHSFAAVVKSERRLNYLYALTVADINATNPKLWNNWRATLLRQLYSETRRALRRGLEAPVDRQESIEDCKTSALERLYAKGHDERQIEAVWEIVGDEFFLRHTPREVAELTALVASHDLQSGPLVFVRQLGQQLSEGGATQVYIYMQDQPGIFAATAITLDHFDLSIFEAKIFTSPGGQAFNRFVVLDSDGNQVSADQQRWPEVTAALERALQAPSAVRRITRRRLPRRMRQLSRPTEVVLETPRGSQSTTLAVVATDRPGLLARIAVLFAELELTLLGARIATLGDRVEDSFSLVAADGGPITDPQRLYDYANHIRQELDRAIASD